jgi:GNAT superfamily N-acetyltransferase
MSVPHTLTDSSTCGFGKHYEACIAKFRTAALALEESMLDVSAGLLFYRHGVLSGLYVVELWELVVRKGTKGLGTSFMSELCSLADKHNITLVLSLARRGAYGGPLWKRTTSRDRLVKFYRRFGFAMVSSSDYSFPATMYREPKSISNYGANTKAK